MSYKVHAVVDITHEVVLSYGITSANAADCEQVIPTLDKAAQQLPKDRAESAGTGPKQDPRGPPAVGTRCRAR